MMPHSPDIYAQTPSVIHETLALEWSQDLNSDIKHEVKQLTIFWTETANEIMNDLPFVKKT